MRVAIVGSFPGEDVDPRWPNRQDPEDLKKSCRLLGGLLAKRGHELSVQHDRNDAADLHVVEGYLKEISSLGGANGQIAVWYPRSDGHRPFGSLGKRHPGTFSFHASLAGKWDSARFEMCFKSHVVIVVGGQERTETTGYMAFAAGRLVLPIAGSGGAAESLLPLVEHRFLNARPLPAGLNARDLRQAPSEGVLRRIVGSLGEPGPTVVLIHGRNTKVTQEVDRYIRSRLKLQCQIMVWDYEPGETLPEKWERFATALNAVALVIASADDKGRYRKDSSLSPRARQNVWLEAGWFWAQYGGRKRILLLPQKARGRKLELPSDLSGLEVFEWKRSPLEKRDKIKKFLQSVAD